MFHSSGTKDKEHINSICQWHNNHWKTVRWTNNQKNFIKTDKLIVPPSPPKKALKALKRYKFRIWSYEVEKKNIWKLRWAAACSERQLKRKCNTGDEETDSIMKLSAVPYWIPETAQIKRYRLNSGRGWMKTWSLTHVLLLLQWLLQPISLCNADVLTYNTCRYTSPCLLHNLLISPQFQKFFDLIFRIHLWFQT